MPEKWDTLLNSGANNISGGQKKRLDIIRGIVKDTDVIIFDESTAYLDIEKRKALFKVVNMIKKDKIIIFITHNLEEVSNYNVIYAFEKGKIKKIESKYVQEIYK
ncbi:MAG: ATP-binding cassette domain-containing protein, partial [Ruminococcus sp.]|nr:ATP-binding cassette domain-containing protein [Ruminococcus sp.]